MSRPFKMLTCACCGKTQQSICYKCWSRDLLRLNDRVKLLEKQLLELDPLNEIFVEKHPDKKESSHKSN